MRQKQFSDLSLGYLRDAIGSSALLLLVIECQCVKCMNLLLGWELISGTSALIPRGSLVMRFETFKTAN
ncbi:hypothetical protein A0H81_06195 [Grifola frondosa]|uniref:Uncharacterized protein n=1 Tax=Grifola frondosa TaxID=5627 RepID=A0A1C7MA76_GRIFR|nr:hypothetical protein A0H81_06195 [Grifola frondosa]